VVTLLEGGTPLVPAPVLSELTGCDVHLKVEGANPTGSFKDRGMTVAMSKAAEDGARPSSARRRATRARRRRPTRRAVA
jgi:threonine synthase